MLFSLFCPTITWKCRPTDLHDSDLFEGKATGRETSDVIVPRIRHRRHFQKSKPEFVLFRTATLKRILLVVLVTMDGSEYSNGRPRMKTIASCLSHIAYSRNFNCEC